MPNRNPNCGRVWKTQGLLNRNPKRPCALRAVKRTDSAIYTPLLAHIYGYVSLESLPASLFHHGHGALRSAMHAAAARARDGTIGDLGFATKALLRSSSRQAACGGNYVGEATELAPINFLPGAADLELNSLWGPWYHDLRWPDHQSCARNAFHEKK